MEEEKLPELPELSEEQKKINELTNELTQLQFLSNQINFNAGIYQGLNLIVEKLKAIEEKLESQTK